MHVSIQFIQFTAYCTRTQSTAYHESAKHNQQDVRGNRDETCLQPMRSGDKPGVDQAVQKAGRRLSWWRGVSYAFSMSANTLRPQRVD